MIETKNTLQEHLELPVKKMVAVVDLIYEAEQSMASKGTALTAIARKGVSELLFDAAHRLREGYEKAWKEANGDG